MYSKVKIAGHPIHPMLVGFPVTFYTVALVLFIASAMHADPIWFRIAVYANVAGVVMAAVAAIPGFIDWAFGIPTGSPAKSTGLAHMACNVVALLLFAWNAVLQWGHRFDFAPPVGLSVIVPALGVAFTLVAGFLGWKMVQTHHVGVDPLREIERPQPDAGPAANMERSDDRTPHGHGQPIR